MINQKKISLCLPCRNEANHLKDIVQRVPKCIDEIIIISNRSTDNTVEVARSIGGKVRVVEDNRTLDGIGYGYAHMTGIAQATGDIISGADADGTYPIEELGKIISFLLTEKLNFISCNRYPLKKGSKIPLALRLGVALLNLEIRLLYGVTIKDALSGMWVFRKEIADKLNLNTGDWNLSLQIKMNAATNKNIGLTEYSIVQRHRLGNTKQHYLKTGLKHFAWLIFNRFRLFAPNYRTDEYNNEPPNNNSQLIKHTLLDWLDYIFLIIAIVTTTYIYSHNLFYYWDSLAYHLPFASRIAGIYSKKELILSPALEARFAGFPLLPEALGGVFWKITGNIGSASLVNLLAYLVFSLYLKLKNGVPIILSTIFLFSIPLITWGYFSNYTDLFVNVFLALSLISIYNFYAKKKPLDILLALIFLSVINNSKYTLVVYIIILLGLILLLANKYKKKLLWLIILFIPIIFFTNLKNLIEFKNPVFPLKMPILSNTFSNFSETLSDGSGSQVPTYIKAYPQPYKYLLSVLEINSYDSKRPTLWTIDQGDVPIGSKSFRMGGYFIFNIVSWILVSCLILRNQPKDKVLKHSLVAITVITIITSFMPQSHELRYWSFVPILLFTFTLVYRGHLNYITKYIYITFQMLALIFVFYKTKPMKGVSLPPFEKYDLSQIVDRNNACLFTTSEPNLFIYRISTPRNINIQFSNKQEDCVYYPLKTLN